MAYVFPFIILTFMHFFLFAKIAECLLRYLRTLHINENKILYSNAILFPYRKWIRLNKVMSTDNTIGLHDRYGESIDKEIKSPPDVLVVFLTASEV